MKSTDNLVIIKGQSQMQRLKRRFNTKKQAKFYMESKGLSMDRIEREDEVLEQSVEEATKLSNQMMRTQVVDKEFLPNFSFGEDDVVVVIGHDGLVANTAKYAKNKPILGVNPDPEMYDGVLLPFTLDNYKEAVERVKANKYQYKYVTMAEARLNDGQRLLAFNDFFIGHRSHKSARYRLKFGGQEEAHSSSGVIVSTGAGSTGWLSSLVNMANGINQVFGNAPAPRSSFSKVKRPVQKQKSVNCIPQQRMEWDADRLVFVVREPFLSRASNISLCAGNITKSNLLELESNMPRDGVIFSDGVEDDFIEFNSGAIVKIGIAPEKAKLVIG